MIENTKKLSYPSEPGSIFWVTIEFAQRTIIFIPTQLLRAVWYLYHKLHD